MFMGIYIFVFMLLLGIYCETVTKKRQRRYLLFTRGTQWGVYGTVTIPVELDSYVSMGWFFEANYNTVYNATWFDPLLGDIYSTSNSGRRSIGASKEIVTRKILYIFIESVLESNRYPGRACMLRAICENADSHFLHNGLVGDLLYFILSPSTSTPEDAVEECFYEAEYDGLQKNCRVYKEECPSNPLEHFNIYADKTSIPNNIL